MRPTTDAPRRRRGILVWGTVLCTIVLIVAASALVWRSKRPSACESIPITMAANDREAGPATIPAGDVLVDERTSNTMSSWNAPTVIVSRDGTAVALSAGGYEGIAYRTATVSPESIDGLRRCVESSAFQDLAADYSMTAVPGEDGRFCAIADASTFTISAGPATASPKTVSAYALDNTGMCAGRPAPLVGLHHALERIRSDVTANGEPTAAPESVNESVQPPR